MASSPFLRFVVLLPLALQTNQYPDDWNCFTIHVDIKLITEPLYQFILPRGTECKEFCSAVTECQTFAMLFSALHKCTLYTETFDQLTIVPMPKTPGEGSIIGSKACFQRQQFMSTLHDITQFNKDGFVMTRSDLNVCEETEVMENGSSVADNQHDSDKDLVEENSSAVPLVWSGDCAARWEITLLSGADDYLTNSSAACNPIRVTLQNTTMCLQAGPVYKAHIARPRWAVLQQCSESNSQQVLLLCKESMLIHWSVKVPQKDSASMDLVARYRPMGVQGKTVGMTLVYVQLTTVQHDKALLKCSNVSVTNGIIHRESSLPNFFLLGESIDVTCDRGYGRKDADGIFTRQFSVTCTEDFESTECFPVPKSCSRKPPSTMVLNLLFVVQTTYRSLFLF